MKSSFFQKATAIVCGAATIASLSIAAFSASADGDVNVITADQVVVPLGTKEVAYTVKLVNNAGFTTANFSLIYDSRLKIQTDGGENSPKYEEGYSDPSVFCNPEQHLLGYGKMSNKKITKDDVMVTVYFDIPADAKEGDIFELKFDTEKDICSVQDGDEPNNCKLADGWIKIQSPTTSSETTTTTTETTTTTSETTTSATTTSEITTSSQTTASETTSAQTTSATSSSNAGTGSTSKSATQAPSTTSSAKATTATTANNGGNGGKGTTAAGTGKQGGVETGDAGVALAIAGLLAAAGTAIVARKKD